MSAFDYSKWDHIELSDDEDDVHPNIDKESWFRMRHRSRVEREENESKDIQNIKADMSKAKQRMEILQHELQKLDVKQAQKQKTSKDDSDDDSDDDDDDLLDDKEAIEAELQQLRDANNKRQMKLDEYEKNKKWNIDNMFQVKEERTVVSASAADTTFNTESGYVVEDNETSKKKPAAAAVTTNTTTKATPPSKPAATATTSSTSTAAKKAPPPPPAAAAAAAAASKPKATAPPTTSTAPATTTTTTTTVAAVGPTQDVGVMETYHEFTTKYADLVEEFMKCTTLAESEQFLLQHASILLQENASNYLLLASLEDEMNGLREKMKLTTRQSQLITNIAELAKTVKTHPGNVIKPFFARLSERKHLEDFLSGVKAFQEKIIQRAIVKKQEIDSMQRAEEQAEEAASEEQEPQEEPQDLHDIPREERLGPGGLDPLEVIETLPQSLVEAFESRNVDELKNALLQLPPDEAEYHMKRCVDSGLWVAGNGGNDE